MEAQREKFRFYIDKSGLSSVITNILVALYEEPNKPADALEYFKEALQLKSPDSTKIQILEEKIVKLEEENQNLREQLQEKPKTNVAIDEATANMSIKESTKDENVKLSVS